jgi:glycosyltransferase involved in cell wall biosynthesis
MLNNLHIYPSYFTHESRILKETNSLAQTGFFDRIYIGALWKRSLSRTENLDAIRRVERLSFLSSYLPNTFPWKILRLFEWELRVYLKFRKNKIGVFNAHSLSVLPLGVMFKKIRGCKLIYDTHELETEVQSCKSQRIVYKIIERTLIHYADIVITVNDSIADWYRKSYALENVHVILNVPQRTVTKVRSKDRLRSVLSIGTEEVLFIYHGILEEGRGINILLKCFAQAQHDKHIVFMGFGSLEKMIKQYTMNCPNIHLTPAVRPNEVVDYISSADVGISLIENTCLSYYYCLPNKLYELILAGVPAIVSDFPEMRRVVQNGRCGWALPVEVDALKTLVDGLTWEEIRDKKAAAQNYQSRFGWHTEEKKLIKLYNDLIGDPKRNDQ